MDNSEFYNTAVESELKKNGVYASVTQGVSMRPLFKTHRDMIILKTPETEPKKYDVVLYKTRGEKFILHRIIKVLPDKFIIRGDNTYVLEYVPKDTVLAVLTEFNRKGKRITVENKLYKIYSFVWTNAYPLRYLVRRGLNLAGKIYRKLFKSK